MKKILFITLLSLLLNNCSTRYNLVFDTKIYKVEKNNELVSTNDGDNKTKSFEDNLIIVKLNPNNDFLSIDIENKSNNTIKVDWKKSFFIDAKNLSSNIKTYWHTPVLPDYEQPITSIPKKSRISEDLFRDATFSTELFYPKRLSENIIIGQKNQSIDSAKAFLLKNDLRFILYIETEEDDYEYTFTINVVDITTETTYYNPSSQVVETTPNDEFIILDLFKKEKK